MLRDEGMKGGACADNFSGGCLDAIWLISNLGSDGGAGRV